jgi:membrane protease YdiL (CAAX protease family)
VLSRKEWPLETVLQLLLGVMLAWAAGVAVLMIAIASARHAGHPLPQLARIIIGALAFHGAGLVLLHRFVRAAELTWTDAFGLRNQAGKAALTGLGVALTYLPIAYGLQWVSAQAMQWFGKEPTAQDSVNLLLTDGSPVVRGTIALFAIGLAPVVEEVLFRGVLFATICGLGWRKSAYLGTALLFGLIHGNTAAFLPLTLFGLVLAWLYERTGNLLAPVVAHAVFNLAPFVLLALGFKPGE